ncbi:NUDIX hydrolase [Aquimarina sediminis]|uniref:NUDIX hydrolase n=1 Tax=Aquimarina sediminis TaxID=2070536 RepID=UPI000CA013BD|nr:NUDIX hydrolase N-terminal domain-containing protein [Aquimarina sediminis]
MLEQNSLELIKRVKSLSEIGLVYAQDEYDKERYEELHSISLELLGIISNKPLVALNDFFMPNKDYPTPKIDIRGIVLNKENQILLVKEKLDQKWSLPGGWGDIGFSPSEVIIKEIEEETGLQSKVSRLLALYDKKCHPHPPQPFYVYKMVFLCEVIEGRIDTSFDIEEARYFDIDKLPELSEDRILQSQIEQLHTSVIKGDQKVYFD